MQDDPKKSDSKAGWVLARMFLILGARFLHSWIERKEVLHASMIYSVIWQMPNQRDRILMLHVQEMRNCDVA